MSIQCSVQVNDPETEALLLYLESRFGQNASNKRTVLKAALEWLEIKCPLAFTDGVLGRCTLRVLVDDAQRVSSEPPDTLAQPL